MHLNGCDCNSKRRGMGSLGQDMWSGAAALFMNAMQGAGKKGGGDGSSGGSSNYVSTSTTTTVSPNISPQFVQQQSPVNSPVGLTAPSTGGIPGFDLSSGYMPGFPAVPPIPQVPLNLNMVAFGALALIGVGIALKMRKKGKR